MNNVKREKAASRVESEITREDRPASEHSRVQQAAREATKSTRRAPWETLKVLQVSPFSGQGHCEEGLTFCKAGTHLGCWKLGTMEEKRCWEGWGCVRGLDHRDEPLQPPYRVESLAIWVDGRASAPPPPQLGILSYNSIGFLTEESSWHDGRTLAEAPHPGLRTPLVDPARPSGGLIISITEVYCEK